MVKVKVDDLRSSHTASIITQATRNIDARALVSVDVAAKTVSIASKLDACRFVVAIRESGYKPYLIHTRRDHV